MLKTTFYLFLITLFLWGTKSFAQLDHGIDNSLYLRVGNSFGYTPSNISKLAKPYIIPQIGFDATWGIIGVKVAGQYFSSNPEFDITKYLDPIRSVSSISNLKEKNSNILLGGTLYLNIGKGLVSLQPGIGLNYLLQS